MLNTEVLQVGDTIEYLGDNWVAFDRTYKVYSVESSYINKEDCPVEDRGKLLIYVESGDDFLFYPVDLLTKNEWRKVDENV